MCGLVSGFCYGQAFGVSIKKAELTLSADSYVLSAEMSYNLSEGAKDALQSGVPLFWDVQIMIRQYRDFFWDKTIVDKIIRYRIQYHALLNMYRVRNEGTGHVENFSTLSAALELASVLQNYPIMGKRTLNPEFSYYAEMKIIFDREALPLPLRPIAYLNSQWYLSSDKYLWPLTK
ncbi:MAG: DUF4390 domain-containing protein [Methylococcaceae bacterium]|nr:DUF4390 domain-containing protein [Methylococcaceae bacterium]